MAAIMITYAQFVYASNKNRSRNGNRKVFFSNEAELQF